jgi:hypothetical protein
VSRELVAYVHVAGRVFAPGDDVPDEYAKKITNPAAWEGEAPAKAPEFDPNTPPPRAGKGSSKEAWGRFASANDVTMEATATRDDIIAELKRRGVIEPEE